VIAVAAVLLRYFPELRAHTADEIAKIPFGRVHQDLVLREDAFERRDEVARALLRANIPIFTNWQRCPIVDTLDPLVLEWVEAVQEAEKRSTRGDLLGLESFVAATLGRSLTTVERSAVKTAAAAAACQNPRLPGAHLFAEQPSALGLYAQQTPRNKAGEG